MDREFCIDYISDDCLDCPECVEDGECRTESHCFEVKQKIMSDLRKLDKIEQIVKDHDNDRMPEDFWYIDKIREVLEQE